MFHRFSVLSAAQLLSGTVLLAIALPPNAASAQECIPPATYPEPPAAQNRTISVDAWQASFSIPANYLTLNTGNTVEILSPGNYEIMDCLLIRQPGHGIRPHRISVSLVSGLLTEADIRAQLTQGRGTFWGPTSTPSGTGYMHSTHSDHERIHLSLPMPNYATTVVFTGSADSSGNLLQEGIFETVLQSFRFQD